MGDLFNEMCICKYLSVIINSGWKERQKNVRVDERPRRDRSRKLWIDQGNQILEADYVKRWNNRVYSIISVYHFVQRARLVSYCIINNFFNLSLSLRVCCFTIFIKILICVDTCWVDPNYVKFNIKLKQPR